VLQQNSIKHTWLLQHQCATTVATPLPVTTSIQLLSRHHCISRRVLVAVAVKIFDGCRAAVALPLLHCRCNITVALWDHYCCTTVAPLLPSVQTGAPARSRCDSPLAARDGSTQWSNDTGSSSDRAPTNRICRRAPLAADLVRGHFISQLELQ